MQTNGAIMLKVTSHCVRCKKELTDAASIQAGIGPECRQKANSILAKEMPTKWDDEGATAAFLLFCADSDNLPADHIPAFERCKDAILTSQGFNAMSSAAPETGRDWRPTVADLTLLASTRADLMRGHLLQVIKCLGYPQYAAYLAKLASASEGKVWIEGTDLYFTGVKNSHGRKALEKAGAYLALKQEGEGQTWKARLTHGAAMLDAIRIYWPLTDIGLVSRVIEVIPQEVRDDRPLVEIWHSGSFFQVPGAPVLPFRNDFINDLKARITMYRERVWDKAGRRWLVGMAHKQVLVDLLAKHYPEYRFKFTV